MVLLLQNMSAMFLHGVYLCLPQFGSGLSTNMAAVGHLAFFLSSYLLRIQSKNFVETSLMDSSHPFDGFQEMIPVCTLIWPPNSHLRNCDFPFTLHCINIIHYHYQTLPLQLSQFLPYPSLLSLPISWLGRIGIAEGRVG